MVNKKNQSLKDIWGKVWSENGSKSYSALRLFKTKDKISFLESLGINFNDKRVLDIGCGDGTALAYLYKKYGISGVGIDIEKSLIIKNQEKYKNYSGLVFQEGDQKSLDFLSNEFDIVLSWGVVEHINEYIYALSEARRVLKTDGVLVLIQPNLWSFGVIQKIILKILGKWRFGKQKEFSPMYLKKILKALGYYDFIISTKVPYKDMVVTRLFDSLLKIFLNLWGHYLYVIARKRNLDAGYKKSFELFLSHTDEKQIIRRILDENIDIKQISSCLDIGGGNGLLSNAVCSKDKLIIIEPNKNFVDNLRSQGFKCICAKWENVILEEHFDLVLAAYSITYLPRQRLKELVDKMISHLNLGGKLVILAVDEKEGSWRGVHTYFYELINLKKESSTVVLKKIMNKFGIKPIRFTTRVFSDNIEQMLEILSFDFCRFGGQFEDNKEALRKYLSQFLVNGRIELEMVHWMFILQK